MLVVALGVTGRPGAGHGALVVHQLVEDLVDEAEVSTRVGELSLDVDEVVSQAVEARGRRLQHGQRDPGTLGARKVTGSLRHAHLQVVDRTDGGGGGPVERRRHLAEDGTGGVDAGERDAIVLNDHGAGDQHQQATGPGAFGDEHLSCGHGYRRQVRSEGQQVAHPHSLLEPCPMG